MDMIIVYIATISSFLIGYFLGRKDKIELPEIRERIKKKLKISKISVGAISRPDSKLIHKWNDPLKDGIDETAKAFKELGVDK